MEIIKLFAGNINKKNRLILLSFSIVVTLFYILCADASLGWRDGPEFITTATFLDIAHPAGFPTYSLFGKFFAWLPLGSLCFRVNIFSSVMGGVAIYFLGLLALNLSTLTVPEKNAKKNVEAPAWWLLVPLTFCALCLTIWNEATKAEVYTLNIAFIGLLLYCATAWQQGRGVAWLYAGGFIYGLSCGNHAAMALYLPFLLLLTFLGQPAAEKTNSPTPGPAVRLGLLACFFLVGLSVYLLLPIRSAAFPPIDFSHPASLKTFWFHITDAKDRDYHFISILDTTTLPANIKNYVGKLATPLFWILGFPMVCVALRFLWTRYQALTVAIPILIIINSLFFLYWEYGTSAFLPTVFAVFVFVCLGLQVTINWLFKYKRSLTLFKVMPIVVMAAVFGFSANKLWPLRGATSGHGALEFFWNDLEKIPPDSIIMSMAGWFSQMGLSHIYYLRPDIPVLLGGNLATAYMPRPGEDRYDFVEPLDEAGAMQFTPEERHNYYLSSFIKININNGRKMFIEPVNDSWFIEYLRPEPELNWIYQMVPDPNALVDSIESGAFAEYLERIEQHISNAINDVDVPMQFYAGTYYFRFLQGPLNMASYYGYKDINLHIIDYLLKTLGPEARNVLEEKNEKYLIMNLAVAYAKKEDYSKALGILKDLDQQFPNEVPILHTMAGIYEMAGQYENALDCMSRVVKLVPNDRTILRFYSELLGKYRSINDGLNFLETKKAEYAKNRYDLLVEFTQGRIYCLATAPEESGLEGLFEDSSATSPVIESESAPLPFKTRDENNSSAEEERLVQ